MRNWWIALAVLPFLNTPSLGEPLTPPVLGPRVICLQSTSFELRANERAVEVNVGVHGGSIIVEGPRGRFGISELERWTLLKGNFQKLVAHTEGTSVYRVAFDGPVTYLAAEPATVGTAEYEAEVRVTTIKGDALAGDAGDADIYSRVRVGDPRKSACQTWYLNDAG